MTALLTVVWKFTLTLISIILKIQFEIEVSHIIFGRVIHLFKKPIKKNKKVNLIYKDIMISALEKM